MTTVHLDPEHFAFLERRGARSDRSHGPFNRSRLLRRKVDLLTAILDHSNPVKSGAFPAEYYAAVRTLLPTPWDLSPAEISFLDRYIERRPDFGEVLAAAGLDPKDFLRRLEKLTYAERITLVDLLEQDLAPAAAAERDLQG